MHFLLSRIHYVAVSACRSACPAGCGLNKTTGHWSSSDPIVFHRPGELVGFVAGFNPQMLKNQRARAGMSGSAHFASGGKSGISISVRGDPFGENSAAAIKSLCPSLTPNNSPLATLQRATRPCQSPLINDSPSALSLIHI